MGKPSSLSLLLSNIESIPALKYMSGADICLLTDRQDIQTVEKDEIILEKGQFVSYIAVVIYGSFNVTLDEKKIGELRVGDICGFENFLFGNAYSQLTETSGNEYKNLVINFRIQHKKLLSSPSEPMSKFYKGIAYYLAHKLSFEHGNYRNKLY